MSTLVHKYVAECRDGRNAQTICRVRTGWVILAPVQVLRGYTLLLPDPVVSDLNSLDRETLIAYLTEMALVGEALQEATEADRINYEILGNSEPALHAHIFPRYRDEPTDLRSGPAWFYDWEAALRFDLDRDRPLMNRIRAQIEEKVSNRTWF
ncbi:MAG TPA: HIT domain-containing protein [Acidimicrobiia bacterium]